MESHFDREFFRGNRDKLRTLFTGKAPIVITANGLLQSSADTTFPFRQDNNFWYLTGIDEPDLVLVIDKDDEYLIVPHRDEVVAMFDGELKPKLLSDRSGIKKNYGHKTGWQQLSRRLKKVKHVATLAAPPAYIERHGFYTNPSRARLVARLKAINDEIIVLDLREHFTKMRVIKQKQELAAMRQAIKITVSGINKVAKRLEKFKFEYEIEAALFSEFKKRGATGHAFDPIIAAGANGCQLHYLANKSPIGKGPILLDVGAEVDHYAADITRTYPLGQFTKRQQAVFDRVEEVQTYALGLLKPGVILQDYEKSVRDYMGEKLRELGLIKTIDEASVRKYFPSLTSHYLGLDVHDVGYYDRPLEPGMVLTVEPGIYIQKEGIGVRIEDDVLITDKGVEVLSRGLPTGLR